ncbi:classical arabinogalactan protein 9-like [Vicia villosa]|uniref:classical arabinogalactan protein 9-like n=1 Tax=Vicia villosa TaxID=3911 RepID=UPI00273CA1F9|nr:classical arabinogalactan protein 9-like [Vicia villosa]
MTDDIDQIDDSILDSDSELPPQQKQPPSNIPPSSSTISKGKQPFQSPEPIILNPPPLNVIFPPNSFSASQPQPSQPQSSSPQPQPTSPISNPQPAVDIPVLCDFSRPSSPSSNSLFHHLHSQDPSSDPSVVIIDSDHELENSRTCLPKSCKLKFWIFRKSVSEAPGPTGLALDFGHWKALQDLKKWNSLQAESSTAAASEADEMELDSDEMEVDNPLPMVV